MLSVFVRHQEEEGHLFLGQFPPDQEGLDHLHHALSAVPHQYLDGERPGAVQFQWEMVGDQVGLVAILAGQFTGGS